MTTISITWSLGLCPNRSRNAIEPPVPPHRSSDPLIKYPNGWSTSFTCDWNGSNLVIKSYTPHIRAPFRTLPKGPLFRVTHYKLATTSKNSLRTFREKRTESAKLPKIFSSNIESTTYKRANHRTFPHFRALSLSDQFVQPPQAFSYQQLPTNFYLRTLNVRRRFYLPPLPGDTLSR